MKKKSTSQLRHDVASTRKLSVSAFFNLRVLIASVFCLGAVFVVLGAAGIYSGSAEAQPANQAQPQSGAPTLVRMIGPVSQDQDLRSLPYIPPAPEIEERRLTRHPHPEVGGPSPSQTSGFARFQSLLKGLLAPVPTMPAPLLTFDGMNAAQSGCGCLPPDSDGDVGPNHYVNTVNNSIKIFDKSGNPLNGPQRHHLQFIVLSAGGRHSLRLEPKQGRPFCFL
jgi:hypothetical protein